jgi:hypothetical protein
MKQDCICRNGLECAACLMKLYAKTATHNVFVYGTLKKGYVNHERTFNGYLHTAMGSTTTLPEWGIAYVSGLPFIVPDKRVCMEKCTTSLVSYLRDWIGSKVILMYISARW